MAIEDFLLNALKKKQAEYALDSLKHPSKRDAFEYGYRVGVVEGLEAAINTLLDAVSEERNADL